MFQHINYITKIINRIPYELTAIYKNELLTYSSLPPRMNDIKLGFGIQLHSGSAQWKVAMRLSLGNNRFNLHVVIVE